MSEELLRLEHLSIDYKVKGGYLSAVNDVNLSVNRGEILAVVGESGCGKSTIAHSIMNLLPGGNEEVEGKILFKGEDLRKYSRKQMEAIRGKDIGMIFQNPLDSLNPVYKTGKQVEEAILQMYQAIAPSMKSVLQCLIYFNLPFTIVKGLISVAICMVFYKPISLVLKGRDNR